MRSAIRLCTHHPALWPLLIFALIRFFFEEPPHSLEHLYCTICTDPQEVLPSSWCWTAESVWYTWIFSRLFLHKGSRYKTLFWNCWIDHNTTWKVLACPVLTCGDYVPCLFHLICPSSRRLELPKSHIFWPDHCFDDTSDSRVRPIPSIFPSQSNLLLGNTHPKGWFCCIIRTALPSCLRLCHTWPLPVLRHSSSLQQWSAHSYRFRIHQTIRVLPTEGEYDRYHTASSQSVKCSRRGMEVRWNDDATTSIIITGCLITCLGDVA